ncbi:MAG: L-galactonate-5-dehydrogenase [Fimbriimonadaceae bacterium]|nr:L-galactonate-5-dehydrogenase [Fimbriimonadaceae bacterium]
MRAAQYQRGGTVSIVDLPEPICPEGGLLVQTEACGLCSGELMDWYMDRKAPHILGHEVCGRILTSQDARFPAGERVFVHHHAPCMECEECRRQAYVHCPTWKQTRLEPGGMAEQFAVSKENLNDAFLVGEMDPRNAALIEPLACVVKSIRMSGSGSTAAVVGLGALGVAHLKLLGERAVGYDRNPLRRDWASSRGLCAKAPDSASAAELVFVLPGSEDAFRFGLSILKPGGCLVMFAPLPPGKAVSLDLEELYFRDFRLATSYSCGPTDTAEAKQLLLNGTICHEDLVSHTVRLDDLPSAYVKMKAGEILKAMVVFP